MQTTIQTDFHSSVAMKADSLPIESIPIESIPMDRKPPRVSPQQWAQRVRKFLARFELAEQSYDLNQQFARATPSSGRSALDPTDRRTIIDRVRHEMFEANPWLKGSARSTVVSVIGRGPWLEVDVPKDPKGSAKVADRFNAWFRGQVNGPRKLRVMEWAHQSDGAGLALIVSNPNLRGRVQLDFVPFDDDHVTYAGHVSPVERANYLLDGKEFDEFGNPVRYWITDKHPVDYPAQKSRPVPADFVIDLWTWERPSQGRGISPYATGAKNGPLLRSYRRAVIDAATTAAKISFLLESSVDRFADGEAIYDEVDPGIGVPLSYGEGMTLPAGWKASQLKAEQPTVGHGEFVRDNVSEMGRAAGQPTAIATGDASGLNFASGQLGRQEWEADVDVQRQDVETEVMDKLFRHWLIEASLTGEIPKRYADIDNVPHSYRWSRKRHQDTQKEYSGRQIAVQSGFASRQHWQTDDGLDPQAEDEAAARGFGVDVETYRKALFLQTFGANAAVALGIPTGGSDDKPDSTTDSEAEDVERGSDNAGPEAND